MVNIYRPTRNDTLSLTELTLYKQIMAYRADNGLDAIPLSKALTTTAGRHAMDTYYNIWEAGVKLPAGANLHSWSDNFYFSDHRRPEVMWFAPDRLGTGFEAHSYEISAAGYANTKAALQGWKNSDPHNDVILNRDGWEDLDFVSIGVGVELHPGGAEFGTIFHVWFSDTADTQGPPDIRGTNGNDSASLTAFADRAFGRGGQDRLSGLGGADTLDGGAGDDTLSGGRGNDRLIGKAGQDSLTGGAGADRFVFGPGMGTDVITDFSATGGDLLMLDDALWAGEVLTAAEVVDQFATSGRGGVTLTFDEGVAVFIRGASAGDLADAILIT